MGKGFFFGTLEHISRQKLLSPPSFPTKKIVTDTFNLFVQNSLLYCKNHYFWRDNRALVRVILLWMQYRSVIILQVVYNLYYMTLLKPYGTTLH